MSDKILDKIHKLLRHAESAGEIGNVHEAAAFASQAQALILKHEMSMEDVEIYAEQQTPISMEKLTSTEVPAPFWQVHIVNVVAVVNGVQNVENLATQEIYLIGRKRDREIAANFIKFFLETAERLKQDFRNTYTVSMEHFVTNGYAVDERLESFLVGYAIAITDRLRETYAARFEQVENRNALVYLDGRAAEAKEWFDERAPTVQLDPEERFGPQIHEADFVNMGYDAGSRTALTDKILA